MSKIGEKFDELKKEGKKALITFVTAGDPDLDTTGRLVRMMEAKGSDIIELGIPYSDPIAEGPVIQAANARAMKNGIKIKDIFQAVGELKKDIKVPIVFLLYYNCMLQYGMVKFFEDCVRYGVDGLIIPDLPYEEKEEISEIAANYPVDIISMVAPTSKERIENIVKDARGFLYCVSSLGVTGMRNSFSTDFDEFFSYIDRYSKIPKAIGFGISKPEHVQMLKGYCDGLIIGSAIVKLVEGSSSSDEAVQKVGDYISMMRKAIDN